MGKIIISKRTTTDPITCIGEFAGECWGAPTDDSSKNYKRGLECLSNNHGRTLEFPQVYIIIDGYSARVMRELYTHIGGGPTRLQASTRYIDYANKGLDCIIPPKIFNDSEEYITYVNAVNSLTDRIKVLEKLGASKEDVANLLPLGMESKMVLRTNLRNLIDMAHQRLCNRAYWEFRELMKELMEALSNYSEEWAFVVKNYFKPKCEVYGYCEEKYTCNKKPSKERIEELIQKGKEYEDILKDIENYMTSEEVKDIALKYSDDRK